MNTRVMATTRHAKGQDLAVQLLTNVSSGIPVVELTGEVVGMVTEFDLLRAIEAGRELRDIYAEEVMTEAPYCVDENTTVKDAMEQMIENRILRIPVLREKKLVGILSRSDLLGHVVDTNLLSFVPSSQPDHRVIPPLHETYYR